MEKMLIMRFNYFFSGIQPASTGTLSLGGLAPKSIASGKL